MAEVSDEVRAYLGSLGKKSAKKLTAAERKERARTAGKGNLEKLTADERSARAKKAAAARWQKKDKKDG